MHSQRNGILGIRTVARYDDTRLLTAPKTRLEWQVICGRDGVGVPILVPVCVSVTCTRVADVSGSYSLSHACMHVREQRLSDNNTHVSCMS